MKMCSLCKLLIAMPTAVDMCKLLDILYKESVVIIETTVIGRVPMAS